MEKRYDVFISYSSDDQKIAEGICGYLERMDYRCFVAYRDIPSGVVWAAAITDAIDDSAMMVVVFSNSFNISPQTDREIELASENKIPILTYRITDDKMTGAKKYYLKNLNWIDAFPNPENYFGQLYDSVVKLIGIRKLESDESLEARFPWLMPSSLECLNVELERYKKAEKAEFEKYKKAEMERYVLFASQSHDEQERKAAEEEQINTKQETTNSINGHEFVDLGLPSGTLWATCNVGANKPEDYGDYYAWDDGKVAAANWGNEWSMPTQDQWQELMQNTKSTWKMRNDVKGRLFTADNGKSLFLPAAGYRWSGGLDHIGWIGYYWLRSLYANGPYTARYYFFSSDNGNLLDGYRNEGRSVRPVRSSH